MFKYQVEFEYHMKIKSCAHCKFSNVVRIEEGNEVIRSCEILEKIFTAINGRPEWCPLKEVDQQCHSPK